jgi:hypothetical protein
MSLPQPLQRLLDKLTGRSGARRPAGQPSRAIRYAKTAADVSNDHSYRSCYNSPVSGITYYVKPVPTAVLAKLEKAPPLHRRLIVKGDAQSYVYLGIAEGQIVESPPADDIQALEIRISMGGGSPIGGDKRRVA